MKFKEFLLMEFGLSDAGSDWFYGNMLVPSDAFDWSYAFQEPPDFVFLKSRWKRERKMGRKFHNLDLDDTLKTKFTSVYSNTMPAASGPGWKNKPDNRANLRVDFDAPMKLHGTRKSADKPEHLHKVNDLVDLKEKLNKTFGKFEPKYYELPKDFDQKWVHKPENKSKKRR
jgi:hypothetical protein